MKKKPSIELICWGLFSFFTAAFLIFPIAGLLSSFFAKWGAEEQESWDHVKDYLLAPAAKDTLILTLGSMIGALLLGIPPAWVLSKRSFRWSSTIGVLLVLPLAIPAYIYSFLVTDIREALVPALLTVRTEFGVDAYLRVEEWSRYLILITVFSSVLYPYVFLAARSAFTGNVKKLEEASQSLGRNLWQTFWKVQLPLARPAIVSSLFLVAMEVMNDYGAVKHFGFNTFTTLLFRTWFGLGELVVAQKLASWFLLGVLVFIILEKLQRGRVILTQKRSHELISHATSKPTWMEKLTLFIPLLLGLLLPAYLLILWGIQSAASLENGWIAPLAKALFNSLYLGGAVVFITLFCALIIAGFVRYSSTLSSRTLHYFLQVAGYACPGAVMAIGVLVCLKWKNQMGLPASFDWMSTTTVFGLLFALTCRYYSVAAQMVHQALERLPRSYDDVSQALGKRLSLGYLKVNIPLISPALFSAMALVFVDVTKELPLSLLLRPFDFDTLGTLTYGLVDQGQLYHCAFPSAALILLCAFGILLVELGGWRKKS